MNDAVYNEYVHVNLVNSVNVTWYEPLEYGPITKGTLRGTIYFSAGRQIHFRTGGENPQGNYRLLIDCDDALSSLIWPDGEIAIKWKGKPEEHYLCVSYEIESSEEKSVICWQKEGF